MLVISCRMSGKFRKHCDNQSFDWIRLYFMCVYCRDLIFLYISLWISINNKWQGVFVSCRRTLRSLFENGLYEKLSGSRCVWAETVFNEFQTLRVSIVSTKPVAVWKILAIWINLLETKRLTLRFFSLNFRIGHRILNVPLYIVQ